MDPTPAPPRGRPREIRRRFGLPAIGAFVLVIGTCSSLPGTYDQVRLLGTLKVATRNSPTAYYQGAGGPEGPEYELAESFARRLGVELELRVLPSGAAALEDVLANRAHVAAAGIIANAARRDRALFGPVYREISQHVVYRVQDPVPATPAELVGRRIVVIRGSTHAAQLARLAAAQPGLAWEELDGVDQLDLFAMVAGGRADVTIADSTEFRLGRHFHPELRPAFALQESEPIAWALAPRSTELLRQVERHFAELQAVGRLDAILARHDRSLARFDRVDAAGFVRTVREKLATLRPLFEEASRETGVDWRLLAAVGYQESRWDPDAVSPTGVRGLMMLTAETAQRVGVVDRTDPASSIRGGARYLVTIRNTIPDRIPEPDRSWMTLAAYNVGYGHLEDARVLAQRLGRNPDRWADVRETLPLLAQERWYVQTRRGYARGWEPVGFVRNVQTYLEVLEWMTGGPQADVRVPVPPPPAGAPGRPVLR